MPSLFSRVSNRRETGGIRGVFLLNVDPLRAAGFRTKEGRRSFEDEVRAKIFGADFVICCKGFRRAALEDRSLVEKVGAVDDGESLADVMVGDYDSDILVLEFRYDLLDVLHGNRVDSCERFVQKNEFRVDCQRTCDLAATTLTTGELDSLALADFMKIELIQKVFQTLQPLLLGELL